MLPVGRMMDMCVGTCTCHKHPIHTTARILSTCPTVMVNGLPIGRMSDMVLTACGHVGYIVGGSSTVLAAGKPITRMMDSTVGCFIGRVSQGSSNVLCK